MRRFTEWLTRKWDRNPHPFMAQDYQVTFSTPHGRRVLTHLLDQVYCQIYEGTDPIAAAVHNGRRSLVQEILENIDSAEQPQKYEIRQERA